MTFVSSQSEQATQLPLIAAVPELASYSPTTGIGRVLHSLHAEWAGKLDVVSAQFKRVGLPLLRNFPYGIHSPSQADLVFLPRFGGAYGLRDTAGVPSLVVVHDLGVVDFPGDRESTDLWSHLSAMQGLRGLRYASRIIAVSQFTKHRLLHYMPELAGRVSVVPNGVDALFVNHDRSRDEARHRVEQAVGTPLQSPLLIYVGSELPRKNIALLLQAFAQLRRLHPGAQLLKVGAPGHPRWRRDTLRTMQGLGLCSDRDVVFLEGSDDTLLADAYRAADVFVSASLYEGFGLPALEALAIGTPVVTTNRGTFPEIVGDAGWVVEPEAEHMTHALCQALSTQSTAPASAVAERIAGYRWSHSALRYVEVIRTLTGANSCATEKVCHEYQ